MNKFRLDDKVRIRLDASEETDISFINAMASTPGMLGVVTDTCMDTSYEVTLENGDSWWYAEQSLEAA